MKRTVLPGHVLFLALFAVPAVFGQQALYAEHKGGFRMVRRVVRNNPYVDDGTGKLVEASGTKMGLAPVPSFVPVYVSVRHLKVETHALVMMDSGAQINKEFTFRAEFEAPYPLKDVFVVLDLSTDEAGKALFVREVGDLQPHEPLPMNLTLRLNQSLGSGKYQLHVFTEGMEVFHSEMPFNFVERKLDDIVRKQVKGITDAQPKPFVGPAPEYPEKLERSKVKGTAVIRFTISPTGRVLDPTIKTASDPAFGESALTAARQWRFLPKVVAGRPVAAVVDMPFVFNPPEHKSWFN